MVQKAATPHEKTTVDIEGAHVKLEDILPRDQPSWWRIRHLLLLDTCLLVPMMTNCSDRHDGSLLTGLQSLPQRRDYFNTPTGAVLGALSNACTLGNSVAFPAVTWFNDRWGRLGGLRVECAISVLGAGLQCAAQNYAMFSITRLILGMGFVIALVGAPTPVSELTYPAQRGPCTPIFGPLLVPRRMNRSMGDVREARSTKHLGLTPAPPSSKAPSPFSNSSPPSSPPNPRASSSAKSREAETPRHPPPPPPRRRQPHRHPAHRL